MEVMILPIFAPVIEYRAAISTVQISPKIRLLFKNTKRGVNKKEEKIIRCLTGIRWVSTDALLKLRVPFYDDSEYCKRRLRLNRKTI